MGFLTSSLGKKILMAGTGLFLVLFLIVHAAGNMQLFINDEGLTFNMYAHSLTSFWPIKIISYGLYAFILLHAIVALILTLNNHRARKKGYAVKKRNRNSAWPSRNMGVLGTVILFFLVVHMGDFWFKYKFGYVPYKAYHINSLNNDIIRTESLPKEGDYTFSTIQSSKNEMVITTRDLYYQVKETFSKLPIVIIYLLSMVALGFHLLHGFYSAFQTFGWASGKLQGVIKFVGIWVFAILIPLLYALMPLYFYIKSL